MLSIGRRRKEVLRATLSTHDELCTKWDPISNIDKHIIGVCLDLKSMSFGSYPDQNPWQAAVRCSTPWNWTYCVVVLPLLQPGVVALGVQKL